MLFHDTPKVHVLVAKLRQTSMEQGCEHQMRPVSEWSVV